MPNEVKQDQTGAEIEKGENSCYYFTPLNLEGTDPEAKAEGHIINAIIVGLNACKLWSYWRKNIPLANSGITNSEANQMSKYSTRYGDVAALRNKMIDMCQLRDTPSATEEEQVWRNGQIVVTSSVISDAVNRLVGPDQTRLPPSTKFLELPFKNPDDTTIILDKLPPILHDMGNDMQAVNGWLGLAARSKAPERFTECLEGADLAISHMDSAMDSYADDLLERFSKKEISVADLEKSLSSWGGVVLRPLGIQLIPDIPPELMGSTVLFSKAVFSRILSNVAQNTDKAYLDKYGLTGHEELEATSKVESAEARIRQMAAIMEKRPLYVRVGQSPNPGLLTFDFEDRGPGIQDPDILASKSFIRGRSSWNSQQSKERSKGQHGIGMASSAEIVSQNYGGSLVPVDNPQGAQIQLAIPLVKA